MRVVRVLAVVLCVATLLPDADALLDAIFGVARLDALFGGARLQAPRRPIKRQSQGIEDNEISVKSDVYRETPGLIAKHGYPMETHEVRTEDGYLLTLHRIPRGRDADTDADAGNATSQRPVVLVMHGLLAASDLWVLMGPERGLGFVLADAGYDVWLGNARGNHYSRKHVTLKPRDPKFWDFSWHEMGTKDLPAVIDYILGKTSQSQLFYVGHSMGTTMFFAMASTRPEYNDKIRLMVALAPVAMNGQLRTTFGRYFLPYTRNIIDGFFRSGNHEVFPRLVANARLAETTCQDGQIGQALCMSVYFSAFGIDRKQLNQTMLPVFWSHMLSGTSASTINHYVENHKANRFQWYDKSRRRLDMPLYNLTQITAPVSMHYAMNDALLHPDAVLRLSRSLPNVVKMHRLVEDDANHMDFAFAIDVKRLVFNDVLAVMKKY